LDLRRLGEAPNLCNRSRSWRGGWSHHQNFWRRFRRTCSGCARLGGACHTSRFWGGGGRLLGRLRCGPSCRDGLALRQITEQDDTAEQRFGGAEDGAYLVRKQLIRAQADTRRDLREVFLIAGLGVRRKVDVST